MRYQITVWKYDADAVEYRYECYASTEYQAREVFDALTRGIRGYYQAWLVDTEANREMQHSSVLLSGIGV